MMKEQKSMRILKAVIMSGGVLGALLVAPLLKGADAQTKEPSASPSPAPSGNEPAQKAPPAMPSPQAKTEKITLDVQGMKNVADADKIKQALDDKLGVVATACDQQANTCKVEINPSQIKDSEVEMAIEKLGFQASIKPLNKGKTPQG